jgi:predicted transcriptional regulator
MPTKQKDEQSKHLTAPQKLVEKSRALQVFELAVQNYSTQQIADKLGVTPERVTQIMSAENKRITVAMQDLKERFQTVTMARTEYIYQRLMEVFIAQADAEPLVGPNEKVFKMIRDILLLQKDIAMPKVDPKAAEDNSKNLTINQTFVADSSFYDTALQEMQREFLGYTVHKVDETPVIDVKPDARIIDIENLASQYLPEGKIPNDDDTDDADPIAEPV